MNSIDMTFKTIGNNIKKIRKEKGLSVKELALIANISFSYLYKIENGKCYMSLDTFLNIVEALETNVKKLF